MRLSCTGIRLLIFCPARHQIQATRLNGNVSAGRPNGAINEITAPCIIAVKIAASIA